MIQTLFGTLEEDKKPGLFQRMKDAVTRTRESLTERIEDAVGVRPEIDQYTLDELEAILLSADMGSETTQEVLQGLRDKIAPDQLFVRLGQSPSERPRNLAGGKSANVTLDTS